MGEHVKLYKLLKTTGRAIAVTTISTFLLTATTGCYLFPSEEKVVAPALHESQQAKYAFEDVKKANLEKKYMVTAYFKPAEVKDVYFKYSDLKVGKVLVKPGDYVNQGDVVVQADTTDITKNIEQKETDLRKKELDLASKRTAAGTTQYELESAEIDMQTVQFQLDILRQQLARTVLTAPISGKVIYAANDLSAGSKFKANQTLLTIASQEQMVLDYIMSDNNLNDSTYKNALLPGMEVQVAYKGKTYTGSIVFTPNQAKNFTDGTDKNTLRFAVNGLEAPPEAGDSARVSMVMDHRENVVAISKNLVKKFKSTSYVRLVVNGNIDDRVIKTGLETDTMVEVTEGLQAGDKILIDTVR